MKVVALMIVRNEEDCLPRCLEHLAEQGLQAAVIDNGSTDRTPDILASFAPRVVVHVEPAPFHGVFEWSKLLAQAGRMQRGLDADWFHMNSPDEIMNSQRPGERLLDAVRRVDAAGFTAINYEEFVFLPVDEKMSGAGQAFDRLLRHYYFYAPSPLRQMRTWKNQPGLSNVDSGGHHLQGPDIRLYPENLVLRHYIALSADQFRRKYAGRIFPPQELAKGWHANRVNIDTRQIRLPPRNRLKELTSGDLSTLDRSDPWTRHFWEMEQPGPPGFLARLFRRQARGS